MYRNAYGRIGKCLSVTLLVLLLFYLTCVTSAAEGNPPVPAAAEQTPAPRSVWINGGAIRWHPEETKSDLKFRIYWKDKWSGESFRLIATRKGYDSDFSTSRAAAFSFRDATNEKDPQVIIEKKNGNTYYSLPAVSGHKYKVAVKVYDEKYGLWSDKATAEYYFISIPKPSLTVKGKRIVISWKPVPGATKYYIERDTCNHGASGSDERLFKIVGNDQTKYIDNDIVYEDVYEYIVVAGRGKWRTTGEFLDPICAKYAKYSN